MDFKKAAELLSLCKEYDKPISQIMMDRECEMTEKPLDEIRSRMAVSLQIMKDATKEAINQPSQSMGGLIGGESRKLSDLQSSGKNIAGNLISKAIAYSMGVLEVNASMGLIVAAPTAGSSGVIPGVLLALQEEYDFTDDQIIDALFTCSAIGYLAMLNATVAGAVGGCQAEIGVAAAMAAALQRLAGRRRVLEKSLVLPAGRYPKGCLSPPGMRPVTTSLRVPSPPEQMMRS